MSKELIERLREAALLLTDKAAMDLNAAASVIEIMVADRDALAAELKALREQEPVAWNVVSEGRKHGLHRLEKDARSHVKRLQCHPFSAIATAPTAIPLYAHPVPACELTTSAICELWAEADDINDFGYAIERYLKGEGE